MSENLRIERRTRLKRKKDKALAVGKADGSRDCWNSSRVGVDAGKAGMNRRVGDEVPHQTEGGECPSRGAVHCRTREERR